MTGKTVEKDVELVVNKELSAKEQDLADRVTNAIKPLIEGITGVRVSIVAKLGAGDPYKTIEGIVPIRSEGDETIDLAHKEGEVWLVDFWATWCPPCQRPMAHN